MITVRLNEAAPRKGSRMSTPDLDKIAARLREQRAAEQAERQERARVEEEARQVEKWSREQEQRVFALIEEVVAGLNVQSPEPLLMRDPGPGSGVAYRFGTRRLNVHFFRPGELYENPEVPGRMNILRNRRAEHGGYIEIQEDGEDREGWNLVLLRRPETGVDEWLLVETDFSALSARVVRYRPFATQARLFADNLACHWDNSMHVYVLRDKPLERDDIVRILEVFAG